MRIKVGFGMLAVCLCSGMCTIGLAKLTAQDQKLQTTIRVEDIGATVKVVGLLGVSMHEVMAMRGTWIEVESDFSKPDTALRFRISHVNGNQLDKPIDFRPNDITVAERGGVEVAPTKGEQWELRAYESWPVRNHPEDYWDALGMAPPAPPPHGATQILGVLIKRSVK